MGKSRTDKPELILIAAKNWFPIKVVIEGKARRMTVMYFYKGEFKTYFAVTTALFTSATTRSDFIAEILVSKDGRIFRKHKKETCATRK